MAQQLPESASVLLDTVTIPYLIAALLNYLIYRRHWNFLSISLRRAKESICRDRNNLPTPKSIVI